MLPSLSDAIECGVLNSPGPEPGAPHCFTQSPFLSNLATRELMYPSLMKIDSSLSQVTSVGWRNCPLIAASGGVTCFHGTALSSDASFFRPKTIVTCPAGLKRTIMSEPLSMAQILSCLSTRTACAYDHAYKFLPISRM